MVSHPAARIGQAAPTLQGSSSGQHVYRAATELVPVHTSVTDESGRFIRDLTKADFELRDNGVLRPIDMFVAESVPIDVIVLMDGSRSLVDALNTVTEAADNFVLRLRPDDKARVGSFSDEIRLSRAFTGNRDELSRQVTDPFDFRLGMQTRLWDAVALAASSFGDTSARRVVIAFTDGDDTSSTMSFDDAVHLAARAGVRLYLILLAENGPSEERETASATIDFRELASLTGGGYYVLNALDDLNAAATRISRDLHSTYTLAFAPTDFDGKRHKLNVHVKRTGLLLRARDAYVANRAATVPPSAPDGG